MRKFFIATVLLATTMGITGLMGGCAAPSVKSQVLVPAKNSEAARLRSVAILPFVNKKRNDDNVTADIEAAVASIRVHDKPYFNVIERTQIKRIIDEQRLGVTGLIDQNTAVSAGKIVGVDAILMGTITQFDVDKTSHYQERSRCNGTDSKGNCKSWSTYNVSCTKRIATFAFVPKVISVKTGKLVFSESISRQTESTHCENKKSHSDNDLLNIAKTNALNEFKHMIAPHYVEHTMVLLSEDDSNPPELINQKIEGGIEFAEVGRMDRACTLWESAAADYPKGYVLPYLLGVCAESEGNLVSAGEYYKLADSRTITPVEEINTALLRIDSRGSNQSKLNRQLKK